jgi:hypothetical protein
MKTKQTTITGILLLLGFLCVAPTADAFCNPSTGRWLNRDPMAERGEPNVNGFVRGNPIIWFDRLGREPMLPPGWAGPGSPYNPSMNPFANPMLPSPTTFTWFANPCFDRNGNRLETQFIQVGYDGWPTHSGPFVDDGTSGFWSDQGKWPALYPNVEGGFFNDTPGDTPLGVQSPFLWRIKFIVCRVCLEPCCGGKRVVSIGPCVKYQAPTKNESEDLGTYVQTESPPLLWNQTVAQNYPFVLTGKCFSERTPRYSPPHIAPSMPVF